MTDIPQKNILDFLFSPYFHQLYSTPGFDRPAAASPQNSASSVKLMFKNTRMRRLFSIIRLLYLLKDHLCQRMGK